MSLLRRVAGRSLRDRVRSSVIREQLLLHIQRIQLRWLEQWFRTPREPHPQGGVPGMSTGMRLRGRHVGGTVSLSWPENVLGFPQ